MPRPIVRITGTMAKKRRNDADAAGGRVTGYIALALSIISLFMLPVLLGIAGIIVGYIARRQGALAWSMGNGYRCSFLSAWHIYYPVFLTEKA